jgi:hypothetical protein
LFLVRRPGGWTPLTARLVRGERATRAVVLRKQLTSLGGQVTMHTIGGRPFLMLERRPQVAGVQDRQELHVSPENVAPPTRTA